MQQRARITQSKSPERVGREIWCIVGKPENRRAFDPNRGTFVTGPSVRTGYLRMSNGRKILYNPARIEFLGGEENFREDQPLQPWENWLAGEIE